MPPSSAPGNWTFGYDVSYRYNGGGMSTRLNPGQIDWPTTPITTNQLLFQAISGDNVYSVSEIQAFGSAVQIPEPAAVVLAITGLGTILSFRGRKG